MSAWWVESNGTGSAVWYSPICPVYGLGALAILLLPPLVRDSLPLLFPRRRPGVHGGGVCDRAVL